MIKSADGKSSLLQYIVELVDKKHPKVRCVCVCVPVSRLLQFCVSLCVHVLSRLQAKEFVNQMQHVREAVKLESSFMQTEVANIGKQIKKLILSLNPVCVCADACVAEAWGTEAADDGPDQS